MISRGKRPEVGETVRFLPEHCMMQKVHSGSDCALRRRTGEDRGDRSEGVVEKIAFIS